MYYKQILPVLICLFVIIPASLAQEQFVTRITTSTGTEAEPVFIPLDFLEVGQQVEVEIIRLSGDLIPIVGLYNTTENRFAFRYRDFDQDGRIDETENSHILNEEAGNGVYELQLAADPEIGQNTMGDVLLIYTVWRNGRIVNEAPPEREQPIIVVDSPRGMEEQLILRGNINDDTNIVFYRMRINSQQPLQFELNTIEGDLDPFMGITPATEEQYQRFEANDGRIQISYPRADETNFESGNYIVAISREGIDRGGTSGEFELIISMTSQED